MTNASPDSTYIADFLSQMHSSAPRFIEGHVAKIAIIGTGAFGSALAFVAMQGGCQVTAFSYDANKHSTYDTDVTLAKVKFEYLSSTNENLANFDLIILAIASQALRDVCAWITTQQTKFYANLNDMPLLNIVCAAKGIELNTYKIPSQVMHECLPKNCVTGTLSGPSFAKELRQGLPAAIVVASENKAFQVRVKTLLHRACFRVYDSSDTVGIEIAGALKNVIAIVAGACDGLGLGNNAKAAVVTRGFGEIIKIGMHKGAQSITFLGLGGLGDLFLTTSSSLSRNWQMGFRLGKGDSKEDILASLGEVVEGVTTAKSAYLMSRELSLDTPVIDVAYGVLYENMSIKEAILALVTRHHKGEFDWMHK